MEHSIDHRAELLKARDYTLHVLMLLDYDAFDQHLTDQQQDRNDITRIETYAQLRRDIHRKVAQVQTDYDALLALCDRTLPPPDGTRIPRPSAQMNADKPTSDPRPS